jgi:hypothetical protein
MRKQCGGGVIDTLPQHQPERFARPRFVVDEKTKIVSGMHGTAVAKAAKNSPLLSQVNARLFFGVQLMSFGVRLKN